MTARMQSTRPSDGAGDILLLIGGLSIASALELAVLRTFTRSAIHIPALETLQQPYKLLTTAGEYAYFVAIVLLVPALLALAVQLFKVRAPFRHLAAFGIVLFALPTGVALLGGGTRVALDLGAIASVVILSAAFAATGVRSAIPVVCFAAAFATSGSYGVIPALSDLGIEFSQPTALLNTAELFGMAFALTLPLMLDAPADRKTWLAGIVVGLLVVAIFLGNGSTSRFLLLWNVGLSGVLPGIFYGVAATALTITGVGLARSGRMLAAAGLLLLVTGGIGLHSTYQSALAVAGLATLCCAATQFGGVRPKPVSQSLESSPHVLLQADESAA